jgi:translation initiation factor IF-2
MPVSVSGLSSVPGAGDKFYVFDDLQKARAFAEERERRARELSLVTERHVTLEKLFEQMAAQKVQQLNVILKADVQGSVEVLRHELAELQHPEVAVSVLHAAVGGINESDVLLADASDAVIIGFQVVADDRARAMAEAKGVDIRLYRVIYQITDDLKKALEGMLAPETREETIGHLVVRQTFRVSRLGTVAGCFVTDGTVRRGSRIRISRQGIVMYEGEMESLKRFKDDAREVQAGLECGVKIKGFDDIKMDDAIEVLETVEVKRTL